MVRLAWLVHKEGVTESDKVVELEEFLRSVAAIADEPKQQVNGSTSKARMSLAVDDVDDALEALDDEVLSEEPAPSESVPQPLEAGLPRQAREVPQPLEIPLPAVDSRLDGAPEEAALPAQAQAFVLDQRSNNELLEAPRLEPQPHQVDELLDEALSETFPASDPIAVSAADNRGRRPARPIKARRSRAAASRSR